MTPIDDDEGAGNGPDRVLRLADYDTRDPARIVAGLRDYWWSLRRGRAIPSRADVNPAGMRAALDQAFILERVAPGAARFRLAGRHLVDLMGMEVRGMPLCAFLNPAFRGRLSDVLEAVFKAPQIAELDLLSPAGYARPELAARMVILPLKSDLGDVTRALGCLAAQGEIGTGPRRFDILADRASPVIDGARILDPSPSIPGLAEPPTPWRPAVPSAFTPPPSRTAPPAQHTTPARETIPEAETPEARRARFRIISND